MTGAQTSQPTSRHLKFDPRASDVNKDWTCKDEDKNKDKD